jgi:uncharacterized protein YndB with AHSA1/START domain
MAISAPPAEVFAAFVDPKHLTRFWLAQASGPLEIGEPVEWHFLVAGAKDQVIATHLQPDEVIAWKWSDGTVRIELEAFADGTAITLINENFPGSKAEQIAAALSGTEGFAVVLCDLKTLLETGKSAGLTRAKASLIEASR